MSQPSAARVDPGARRRHLWEVDPGLRVALEQIVAEAAGSCLGAHLVLVPLGQQPSVAIRHGALARAWREHARRAFAASVPVLEDDGVAVPIVLSGVPNWRAVLLLAQPGRPHWLSHLGLSHAARLTEAIMLGERRLKAMRDTAHGLLAALVEYDPDSAKHSRAVSVMAVRLALVAGVQTHELLDLELAALLHDIGKLLIPQSVLRKPGKLDAAEWSLIRMHPAAGERLVRGFPQLVHLGPVIRHHHERWDGTGYLDALAGPAIPLHSRLIAMVDAFEVLGTGRPYQRAFSPGDILNELWRHAGTQFDPAMLQVLSDAVGPLG